MPSLLTLPVGPRDHIKGPESAAVTVVEYGDFECPQCAAAYPIVGRVLDTFGDRARFVFRHFPLTSSHPNAQHAAEEAEWAAAQDKFWPMYDALYAAQKHLSDRRMLDIAAGLGLAGRELEGAWAAHTFIARVKEDFVSGLKSGVTGTPSFFINGVRHEGGWDEISLSHAIEAALK
jgi:protein-disulfide isomerase